MDILVALQCQAMKTEHAVSCFGLDGSMQTLHGSYVVGQPRSVKPREIN
jgi:hypothetical protein